MVKLPTFEDLARYMALDGPMAVAREKYIHEWFYRGSPKNEKQRERASQEYADILVKQDRKLVKLELSLLAMSMNGALEEKGFFEDEE